MTYTTSILLNTTVYARGCIQSCNKTDININGVLSPGIYCCQKDYCNNIISIQKNKAQANLKFEFNFFVNYLLFLLISVFVSIWKFGFVNESIKKWIWLYLIH